MGHAILPARFAGLPSERKMLRRRDGLLAIAAVLDGHGLHRMVDDADRAVVNAGRDANKITRSCALSFVVGFSMVYSRRQLWAKAREVILGPLRACLRRSCGRPTGASC
jgi:hypothetical protein